VLSISKVYEIRRLSDLAMMLYPVICYVVQFYQYMVWSCHSAHRPWANMIQFTTPRCF